MSYYQYNDINNDYKKYDPYQILGVDKLSSPEEIYKVYKSLILALHSDKKHTDAYKRLNISENNRIKLLEEYNKAYSYIKDSRKTAASFPDHTDIDYEIGSDVTIEKRDFSHDYTKKVQLDTDLKYNYHTFKEPPKIDQFEKVRPFNTQEFSMNKTISDSLKTNFHPSVFNQVFEQNAKYMKENGYKDPNDLGSAIFSNSSDEDPSKRSFNSYKASRGDIKAPTKQEMAAKLKPHDLSLGIRHDDNFNVVSNGSIRQHEIGGNLLGNFSITAGPINGQDLDEVYGQDFEYYEDSYSKNNKDYNSMRQDYENDVRMDKNTFQDRLQERITGRNLFLDKRSKVSLRPPTKINGFEPGTIHEDIDTNGMDSDIALMYTNNIKEQQEKERIRANILKNNEKYFNKNIQY